MEIDIRQAKNVFLQLLEDVEKGQEVTITRAGVPIARLVGVSPKDPPIKERPLGMARGKVWVSDDFDDPMELRYVPKKKHERKARARKR